MGAMSTKQKHPKSHQTSKTSLTWPQKRKPTRSRVIVYIIVRKFEQQMKGGGLCDDANASEREEMDFWSSSAQDNVFRFLN